MEMQDKCGTDIMEFIIERVAHAKNKKIYTNPSTFPTDENVNIYTKTLKHNNIRAGREKHNNLALNHLEWPTKKKEIFTKGCFLMQFRSFISPDQLSRRDV